MKEMSNEELWERYCYHVGEMFFQWRHSSNGYNHHKNIADEFLTEINARENS
jgi:hypothetical protein